jgi:hypothetical protein
MKTEDYLEKTPGEIYGLVACHLVSQGLAKEVKKKKRLSYDDALRILK